MGEYVLTTNNYNKIENTKKRIIFGNTFSKDMKHFIGWEHRNGGKYKKTTSYTIDKLGNIHNHFDPKYQSDYFKDDNLNDTSIIILIENEGQLSKNDDKNEFYTYLGNIYRVEDDVVDIKWKSNRYWSPYNEKQYKSALKLVDELIDRFDIPRYSVGHNTLVSDLRGFGVIFKSNMESNFTDMSPAWNFKRFKREIENN